MRHERLDREVGHRHRRLIGFQKRLLAMPLADVAREDGALSDCTEGDVEFMLPGVDVHDAAGRGGDSGVPSVQMTIVVATPEAAEIIRNSSANGCEKTGRFERRSR
jgi:hypothetical protein